MPSKHGPKVPKSNLVPETPESNAPEASDSGNEGGRNFVPTDEFKQFQSLIEGQLSAIQANLGAVLSRNMSPEPQRPAQILLPDIVEPTDEEIEEAMQSGHGAAMMRRLAQIEGEKRERQLLAQHINPLRETGVSALAKLTEDAARAKLPYYSKYADEIRSYLGQLPADALTNPSVYEVAYAKVVSDHLDEIVSDRVRAAQGMADADVVNDPVASLIRPVTKQESGEKIPTVEELCGADAAQALKSRNQSPDAFARQLGYADWAAYAKVAKDMEAN